MIARGSVHVGAEVRRFAGLFPGRSRTRPNGRVAREIRARAGGRRVAPLLPTRPGSSVRPNAREVPAVTS